MVDRVAGIGTLPRVHGPCPLFFFRTKGTVTTLLPAVLPPPSLTDGPFACIMPPSTGWKGAGTTMKRGTRRGPSRLVADRLRRIRAAMKKSRIAAYLITHPSDYFHLTGFTGEDSAVLVLPRAVHVLSDGRFDEVLNRECPWATRWMRKGLLTAEIARACTALKLRTLAVQPERMSLAEHAAIRKQARGTRLTPAPPLTARMRIIKDGAELALIQRSLRVAEEAFAAVRSGIRLGDTERDIAARLEFEMKRCGSLAPAFPTICAEGANAALPHARPGVRKVKKGSLILLDWGAKVGHYCSDLTRVLFVGSIPRELGRVYEIVLEAQQRAIAAIRPGVKMCDVDAVARNFIASCGYKKAFTHGLGHGMGIDIHEAPSLSWRSSEPLAEGMVVTVEPGVYLPGVGGVRLEDDVVVTPRGCRVLSRLDKSLERAVIPARR